MPIDNKNDIDELEDTVKNTLRFVYVSHMDQVVEEIFPKKNEESCGKTLILPESKKGANIGIKQ